MVYFLWKWIISLYYCVIRILFDTSIQIEHGSNLRTGANIPVPADTEHKKLISLNEINGTSLGIGSCVMIRESKPNVTGVIKWIGRWEYTDSTILVGIETDERIETNNAANWNIHQNFRVPFQVAQNKVIYVSVDEVDEDSRFNDSKFLQNSIDEIDETTAFAKYTAIPRVPALSIQEDLQNICGKFKGIQGHYNSCYIDATIFSMFAFTNILDSELLNKEYTENDLLRHNFQQILRDKIVNPLRFYGCVPYHPVMELREILNANGNGFTEEQKDPEEFLNVLFGKIFNAEPLLKLNSNQGSFLYQLFVEKDERIPLPTVQQLFEQSFITNDIKLTEIPSCLIIQMPRFGNYKIYSQILPSRVLDITDILEDSPRQCTICDNLAERECIDCFNTVNEVSLETSTFCQNCFIVYHQDVKRAGHSKIKTIKTNSLMNTDSVERTFMELFAVLCIETSHYVSFVKLTPGRDAPWCFFDSMADRKGGINGYNIPELTFEEDVSQILSGKQINFQNLTNQAKRLLGDAYICMYKKW